MPQDSGELAKEIVSQIERRRQQNSRRSPKRGQILRWQEHLKAMQDELALANAEIARLRSVRRRAYGLAHSILEATGDVDIVSNFRGGTNGKAT